MNANLIIQKLQVNKVVFKSLLENSTPDCYSFRTNEVSWCLLEVICHLFDEEVEDFRARISSILTNPQLPLKPISPERWPDERNYMEQDFDTMLKAFLTEREQSIAWLLSLEDPNWERVVDHPEVESRSAKKFLVNWLAHDYHHIRQINAIHHAYLKHSSGDDLTYAGKW